MKRTGNLIDNIAAIENLYSAFFKAAKGKRGKPEVVCYEKDLDKHLYVLQNQILSGSIDIGHYHYFKIFDPKERVICAASFPERVLHHAIMNLCHSHFERQLIYHTYATRVGKGTYAALDSAKEYVEKYTLFAKLDVRKYFDSISHIVLINQLSRIFKDKLLLKIFESIINSYEVTQQRGIPIGNLTSQYFANYYLSGADHYAKETLKIKGYARYMDDILLFENDMDLLKNKLTAFSSFINEKLLLELKRPIINYTAKGVSFLGYVLLPNAVKLNQNSKQRFCKKIGNYQRLLDNGKWSQQEFSRHTLPLIAFTEYANSKHLRSKIIHYDN